jgi:hypothetical protein
MRKSTYKEKSFTLDHSFRSFSPWLVGPIAFGLVVVAYQGREHMVEQSPHLVTKKE